MIDTCSFPNSEGQFDNQPHMHTAYEYASPTTICTGNTSSTPITSPFGVDSEMAVWMYQTTDTAGLVQLNADKNPMMSAVPQTAVTGADCTQFRGALSLTPALYWIPIKEAVYLTSSAFTGTFTLVLVWRRLARMSIPAMGVAANWGDLTA